MRAREAIPLQVSRLLEERMAAAEGVRHVHHWLSIIGATLIPLFQTIEMYFYLNLKLSRRCWPEMMAAWWCSARRGGRLD